MLAADRRLMLEYLGRQGGDACWTNGPAVAQKSLNLFQVQAGPKWMARFVEERSAARLGRRVVGECMGALMSTDAVLIEDFALSRLPRLDQELGKSFDAIE